MQKMKSLYGALFAVVALVMLVPSVSWAQKKHLTLEPIVRGMFYARSAGGDYRSTPDGLGYTTLSKDYKKIIKYNFQTGKEEATLFNVSTARECNLDYIEDYEISPDGNHILLFSKRESVYRRSFVADVYHYDVRRNRVEPLSEVPGKVMIPTFSPDSRMVAFVRENNIFVKKFDYGSEVQVTTDGKRNHIINGTTDWVYEEEFSTTRLLTWSSDNRFLAFVRFDESDVKAYSMPIYGGSLYPEDYIYKYPKAGEKNSDVSLWVHDLSVKNSKKVNLPLSREDYIPRIEFTEMNNQLAVMTLNRRQNDFRLFMLNPQSLEPKMVIREEDKRYINNEFINSLVLNKDGFVMLSERSGYSHIYVYGTSGQLLRQASQGNFDVLTLYGTDAKGNIYYQAALPHPSQKAIYRVDTKGKTTLLTPEKGTHQAAFSSDYSFFVDHYSSVDRPAVVTICSGVDGRLQRTLEDNASLVKTLASYDMPKKEMITLEISSGVTLNGWVVKPTNFDPTRKYPAVMIQYSGPDSQQVLDSYGVDWYHALAEEGFLVFCFDGRGTGARGTEWRKCTYMDLGTIESDDQIAAAQRLPKAFSFVDGKRIAIWGWSFGGYNVLRALCRGNGTFKAGVAIAPVSDWRFYDTVYTERYMRTPQENPQGYKRSSVLPIAGNLKGELLLISGSADDNVHLQQTMAVSEALVQNNIPFEMAVYTDKNHGIYGGNTRLHLYSKVIDFLKRKL